MIQVEYSNIEHGNPAYATLTWVDIFTNNNDNNPPVLNQTEFSPNGAENNMRFVFHTVLCQPESTYFMHV